MANTLHSLKYADSLLDLPTRQPCHTRKKSLHALHIAKMCNFGLFCVIFGCRGNFLGSHENSGSIFDFYNPENPTIFTKKFSIFLHRSACTAILAYFLPKYGGHVSPFCSALKCDSIYLNSPNRKTLLFTRKISQYLIEN